MKRGLSRRFVLGCLALVAGQGILSRRAVADDPPKPIVPTYARATAISPGRPPRPALDLCASGEGEEDAYSHLLELLKPGYFIQAESVAFSTDNPCLKSLDATRESCDSEHRSLLCKEVFVVCTKFKMVGTGRGLTRAGARRRALRDLECGLLGIHKKLCDCVSLEWIE